MAPLSRIEHAALPFPPRNHIVHAPMYWNQTKCGDRRRRLPRAARGARPKPCGMLVMKLLLVLLLVLVLAQ
jgi:hypothetical protein